MNTQTETREPDATDTAEAQARAQVASIVGMVSALECDYERLQELKDKAEAGHYVAGFNMPGFMPDCEPAAFDDADDAREWLAEAIEEQADAIDDEADYENPQRAHLRAVAAALREMDTEGAEAEYGQTLGRLHYWLTFKPGELSEPEEAKELQQLQEQAGEWESEDDAREAIEQDALSVEYRSDWCSPGEEMTPAEFRIVLCTGGPHVEIVGEIDDNGEPDRPRILYRDWGTSGELFDFDRDAVLTYCQSYVFAH